MLFVGIAAALILYPDVKFSGTKFTTGILALTFSVFGTNALTCWIDRDIDGVMKRTNNRPLPRGELTPRAGLLFSVTTFLIGIIISIHTEPRATIFLILGLVFSAVVYNGYLKRRSPLNIIFASPAGMMPVLFMWSHLGAKITLTPILLGLLIVLWTPAHIWSLAIFYVKDYENAKVPMLPIVAGEDTTIRLIALTNVLLVGFSIWLSAIGYFSYLFLTGVIILNIILLIFTVAALLRPDKKRLWALFKFSSPYLFLIFLLMVADRLILAG